jgi:hypothetical protein
MFVHFAPKRQLLDEDAGSKDGRVPKERRLSEGTCAAWRVERVCEADGRQPGAQCALGACRTNQLRRERRLQSPRAAVRVNAGGFERVCEIDITP